MNCIFTALFVIAVFQLVHSASKSNPSQVTPSDQVSSREASLLNLCSNPSSNQLTSRKRSHSPSTQSFPEPKISKAEKYTFELKHGKYVYQSSGNTSDKSSLHTRFQKKDAKGNKYLHFHTNNFDCLLFFKYAAYLSSHSKCNPDFSVENEAKEFALLIDAVISTFIGLPKEMKPYYYLFPTSLKYHSILSWMLFLFFIDFDFTCFVWWSSGRN